MVEPINIHAYTWGEPDGTAVWTPLMLELRDVYYSEYDETLSPERKKDIMQQIPVDFDGYNSVEFLYLNGDALSWNWGRNGMTNAAFLFGEARDYFRGFF
ncbi:MAG: hypothetical protein JO267_01445 [Alphaproteobacteria bacterium]|nr:hypothetical protein [Alphaproteobacteria bacterium]